ncbi:MAG: transketolase, partial [Clostridiales bacterium]|nr:transketolase [Clostridiales bacterium]
MSTISKERILELEEKCVKIRKDLLNFIYQIGMGHLGGELSMVEMAVALYYQYMAFDPKDVKNANRDRFLLSKGHCSETLYTIFQDLGMYTIEYMVE